MNYNMINMKYMRYIPAFLLVSSLIACGKEEYQAGAESNYSGINIYFVQPAETYFSLDPDASEITFEVARDDAPYEDQYVPFSLTCAHPEAFEVPEAIFFAAGEVTSEVSVYFTDRMNLFQEYALSLTIDEDYTQQYLQQTDYPRIDVTVVKEDYEPAYSCRYTCGGVLMQLIDWSSSTRVVDLEYSEILDAYRVDLWGHGNYVRFSVEDEDARGVCPLVLDDDTYDTGETYKNGDETYDVSVELSGDPVFNTRTRVYTFPFTYCYGGNPAGAYDDQLLVISEL